jgi:hypothetical protein
MNPDRGLAQLIAVATGSLLSLMRFLSLRL